MAVMQFLPWEEVTVHAPASRVVFDNMPYLVQLGLKWLNKPSVRALYPGDRAQPGRV